MRALLGVIASLLSASLLVHGQGPTATEWCDEGQTGFCWQRYYDENLKSGWGYMFPQDSPSDSVRDEFIGIFTAPASFGWLGNSLGGEMRSNPLIVGWINGYTAVVSARRTETYGLPQTMVGPRLTILGGSGITSSGEQRIIYRCQNCTSWEGGGIIQSGNRTFGFATHGSIKPDEPSNAASPLYQHTLAGQHTVNLDLAKIPQYWENLEALEQLPMLPPPTPTTTPGAPGPTATLACPGAPTSVYTLKVADGWRAAPVLGRLARPRSVVMDPNGNLLVLEAGKGVTVHTLEDNGCVKTSKVLISESRLNHGLDLTPTGDKLVASSPDIAWSWDYDPTALEVSNKKTIITGMGAVGHTSRTLYISKQYPELVLASVGSGSNIDLPSYDVSSGRAQIRVFNLSSLPSEGLAYTSGGVMGYGLRNDVGITEDRNGSIYSVENSMDNAFRTIDEVTTDVHNDNPAEKVYRLGDPRQPTSLFGGYPYCYTVWQPDDFKDRDMDRGWWFVQAPNATVNDDWCPRNAVDPIVLLPPHTAPLDMKFGARKNDTNLYVGLHGSWNRSPPQGYKVVVVPGNFSETGNWTPTGKVSNMTIGFTDLLANNDETRCQAGCFRPVGLTFDKTGDRLYVASDSSGEVFLLTRE